MRFRPVPVTMGSPHFQDSDFGAYTLTEAWFPPHVQLEPHTHARAIFAVMIEGSFSNRIAGREYECTPGSFWTEPLGESHSNRGGTAGARVFVLQPAPGSVDSFGSFVPLLEQVHWGRHGNVAVDARRVLLELQRRDKLTLLAVDALVQTMLVSASRLNMRGPHHAPPAPWVRQAREFAQENFRGGFRIADLAAQVGVDPARLAHSFRRAYGTSVGEFTRSLRLNWALEQLQLTDAPIAKIAVSAGYCDQSHLTREVRRALGMGAAAYRAQYRVRCAPAPDRAARVD
jgi:AraC family transcriptional regulator